MEEKCEAEGQNNHMDVKNTNTIENYEETTFEDALKMAGFGKYNYILLAISTYSLLAAAAEIFTVGIVITSSKCDLDIDVERAGLISSIPVLGVVVSAHFWGFLADTRGRRFALLISTAATFFCSLIASFSYDWIFLAVIKFIGIIFASGTNAITYALLGESTIGPKRERYLLYASTGVLSFQLLNVFLAYPILRLNFSYYMTLFGFFYRPWRLYLQLLGLISGINLILVQFFTFESPKFYFAIGKHDEGLAILQKIHTLNSGSDKENYSVKKVVLNKDDYKTERKGFFKSIWEQTIPIFRKKYIKNTILIFLTSIPPYSVSPPFSVWLPFVFNAYSQNEEPNIYFCDLFQSKASEYNQTIVIPECDDSVSNLTFAALAAFATYLTICSLIIVFIVKYIGKKWTYVSCHVVCAIFSIIINHTPLTWGIISLIGMTANVICMGVVTAYTVELFPTYMRAMAVCLAILIGRAFSMVLYNVIGTQLQNNCDNFLIMICSLLLFGAIAGLFLPADRVAKKSDVEQNNEDNI